MDAASIELAERVAAETRRHFDEVAADLRTEFGDLRQEVGNLRQEVGGLRQEVGGLRQEVVGVQQGLGGLRQEFADLRQEFGELRQEFAETKVDLRHQFDIVAEGMRDDLRFVAEGQVNLSESVDRRLAEFRTEFKEELGEVRS